jgi:hypothetical protein
MATVNKKLADTIKDNDGYYSDDPRVMRIVEYENAFNGTKSYGIEYAHEVGKYAESEFIRNPTVYWEAT